MDVLIYSADGGLLAKAQPESLIFDSQAKAPADYLSVTLELDCAPLDRAAFIKAVHGARTVFSGAIDSVCKSVTGFKRFALIRARSAAALLLDNEAKPASYSAVSPEVIFESYLRPFGIADYECRNTLLSDNFEVQKGMSCYDAVNEFCKRLYGAPLVIYGDKAYFGCLPDNGELSFTDTDRGVKYMSVSEYRNRSALISRVNISVKDGDGYILSRENELARSLGVQAERYISTSEKLTLQNVEKIPDLAQRAFLSYKLVCPGGLFPPLYARARLFGLQLGKVDGLYISRVHTVCSSGKKTTTVYLSCKGG